MIRFNIGFIDVALQGYEALSVTGNCINCGGNSIKITDKRIVVYYFDEGESSGYETIFGIDPPHGEETVRIYAPEWSCTRLPESKKTLYTLWAGEDVFRIVVLNTQILSVEIKTTRVDEDNVPL